MYQAEKANQFGIETIKQVLAPVLKSIQALVNIDANRDKKISNAELFGATSLVLLSIAPVAGQFAQFGAEVKDLTKQEDIELLDWAYGQVDGLVEKPALNVFVKATVTAIKANVTYLIAVGNYKDALSEGMAA